MTRLITSKARRFGRPQAYLYWGLAFARLAHYMKHWKVPAKFYGIVLGRRVFIGVLVGEDPVEGTN